MKRTFIISLLVAAMGVIAFMGCEKPEEIENPVVSKPQTTDSTVINPQTSDTANTQSVIHNTELSYSDCNHNFKSGIYDPIISPNYNNGIFQLMIENFCISCGVYNVFAESEIDAQTISVNLRVIYESQANCICSIDVDYSIDNIKPGNYELIISNGGWVIYQEEITCE